MSAFLVFVSGH